MSRSVDPKPPTDESPIPSLLVRDLHFRYPDGRAALRGVDLRVEPGDAVALVGPNGAGKSTLLLHLNGILPGSRGRPALHDHATGSRGSEVGNSAGPSVWVDGIAIGPKTVREIRRRVGLVFQDPDDQLFATSVLEDVAFGPLNLGLSRHEARSVALAALEEVGLVETADRPPHHLSFGERKRVCLAGVLACRPTVLVLDEPTANLDPRGRRRFLQLIASLPATRLIATHDLEMVLEICAYTVLLDEGRVVNAGPTRTILSDRSLLEAHGLELPYSLQK